MSYKKFVCSVTFCLMFTAVQAWGAGFALYENSSRGTAVCGAFVAQADDPSALFYNPSGMTQIQGRQISSGVNTYSGFAEIHGPGGGIESVKEKTWVVPNMYLSQQAADGVWVGLGVFAPFGLGNSYRENWFGRYNMYHTEIACVEINPNIAFKVTDSLSLALGMSRQSFEILAKRKLSPKNVVIEGLIMGNKYKNIPPMAPNVAIATYETSLADLVDPMPDIDQRAFLDNTAYRFNMSFRYQANDKISIGGNFRSKVDYTLTGNVQYQNVPVDRTLEIHKALYNAKVSADLTLPDIFVLGAAFKITDQLTIEADIVHTRWAQYDKLTYHFENGLGTVVEDTKWKNVNCYRFGAEFKANDQLALRVGYLFDESPLDDHIIDFALPGNDRHLFTTGFGYKYKQFIIDAHYGLVICLDRENSPNENKTAYIDYDWQARDSYTHHLGFNISYVFN